MLYEPEMKSKICYCIQGLLRQQMDFDAVSPTTRGDQIPKGVCFFFFFFFFFFFPFVNVTVSHKNCVLKLVEFVFLLFALVLC